MVNKLNIKSIDKIKRLAAKGKNGLFLATLWLASIIIARKIWQYTRRPVFRLINVVLICVVFIATSSFAPVTTVHADSITGEGVSEVEMTPDGMLVIEDELPQEEYLLTEVTDEDDVASLDDLMEHLDEEVEIEQETDTEEGAYEGYEFDKSAWNLLLINKQHPVPDDYTFTLGTIKGNMKCDERIIEPLAQMFKAAAYDGINLEVRSPYRDISRQEYLFDRKMKNYINQGYSYIDAYKESSAVVTVPGASEHQIGISLDITSDTYSMLNEGFEDTDAGKWLKDNSYKYGFILRYPKGKEDITGIIYEPWHFRYVGVEAATVMYEQDLTLEEFIDSL
ncbi:MAG: M15 family metallopeptidase [Lachnospiraceae bacterium]|nr:M15 family metallopeptidase [Lachnospiraceae bacterium]